MIFAPPGHSSSGIDTGDIGHSLRFRSSASAYLSRTFGAATNVKKWTWAGWVKIGKASGTNSSSQTLFSTGSGSSDSGSMVINLDNGRIIISGYTTSLLITTNLVRDHSGPVFIQVSFDSANASQNLRANVYANGVECSYATDNRSTLSGSSDYGMNKSVLHTIGAWSWNGGSFAQPQYFDGYLSRICFVDGQALTPSSFGYFNTAINEWVSKSQSQVKAVVDAGGANSFMLDFDNGTSLTTLGYDKSSKGNHWTLNNFSLTAGPSYDWMLDVPGNSYAVLNPLIPSAANITNGNLSSGTTAARATMNSTAFDSQWFVTAGGSAVTAGVIDDGGTTHTTSVTANKVFAFKMTSAGALSYKNVTDAGSWTSIATGLTGNRWPYSVTQAASWNFGQQPLPEALDIGFKALCQRNLPEGETITTNGTFAGNLSADGPYVDIKGTPTAMTINGNAVTFGTHADKTAFGFKVRSASSSYNNTGSNTYSITSTGPKRKYALAKGNP